MLLMWTSKEGVNQLQNVNTQDGSYYRVMILQQNEWCTVRLRRHVASNEVVTATCLRELWGLTMKCHFLYSCDSDA